LPGQTLLGFKTPLTPEQAGPKRDPIRPNAFPPGSGIGYWKNPKDSRMELVAPFGSQARFSRPSAEAHLRTPALPFDRCTRPQSNSPPDTVFRRIRPASHQPASWHRRRHAHTRAHTQTVCVGGGRPLHARNKGPTNGPSLRSTE